MLAIVDIFLEFQDVEIELIKNAVNRRLRALKAVTTIRAPHSLLSKHRGC